MKKLTGILCTVSFLITVSSFTFPKDDTVSSKVKSAFQKTFTASSNVYWEKVSEFYIATFKVDGQDFSAAYNEEGELVSALRYISLSQLPLSISLALENKYADYVMDKSVTELSLDGQTSYIIKAQNSKYLVKIKATGSGYLGIESRTKK